MLLEETLRTCANRSVADAAIHSIGQRFAGEIEEMARVQGVSVGEYVSQTVTHFARSGNEAGMRSVRSAMVGAQEPILAGLHRILSLALTAEQAGHTRRSRNRPAVRRVHDAAAADRPWLG